VLHLVSGTGFDEDISFIVAGKEFSLVKTTGNKVKFYFCIQLFNNVSVNTEIFVQVYSIVKSIPGSSSCIRNK